MENLWNVGVVTTIKNGKPYYTAEVYGLRAYRVLEVITPLLTHISPKRIRAERTLSYGFAITREEYLEFLRLSLIAP